MADELKGTIKMKHLLYKVEWFSTNFRKTAK